jgi:hypothetical protein
MHESIPKRSARVRTAQRIRNQCQSGCRVDVSLAASFSKTQPVVVSRLTLIDPDFGNWYGCVGNFGSCQRRIFVRFPEGHRFKTLNVRSAKQESLENAITWPTGNLWQLLRLRFLKNGMPISIMPTATNGISCERRRPSARSQNSGAM